MAPLLDDGPIWYMEEVRDIIDPNRNISGKNGTRWRFRKYEDADKIWTYLMLKYS